MVALWTAHAKLSRFYLDSTPRGCRELGPRMRIQRSEGLVSRLELDHDHYRLAVWGTYVSDVGLNCRSVVRLMMARNILFEETLAERDEVYAAVEKVSLAEVEGL